VQLSDVKRLRSLEDVNRRLKKLVAYRSLDDARCSKTWWDESGDHEQMAAVVTHLMAAFPIS
jgi:hypothetical protein